MYILRLLGSFMMILLFTLPAKGQEVSFAGVGDIFFGRGDKEYGGDKPFQYVDKYFLNSDVVLGNLETPLVDERVRLLKLPCSIKKMTCKTPEQERYRRLYYLTFNARPAAAKILKDAGFSIMVTANNHAEDQGSKGILKTKQNLTDSGLATVGTGSSQEEAWTPLIIERKGIKIGIIAATSIANFNSPKSVGHYAFSKISKLLKTLPGKVKALKKKVDFVIVTLHYSAESMHQTSRREKKLMRLLEKAGADLFIGHHPHVLRGIQVIGNMVVFYSMGNFLFDARSDAWGESGIARLNFVKDESGTYLNNVNFVPVKLDGTPNGLPRPVTGEDAKTILCKIKKYSKNYKNPSGTLEIDGDILKVNILKKSN